MRSRRSIARRRPPSPRHCSAGACGRPAIGGSQTTDGNAVAGSNNATSRIYGMAVGADYRFSPGTARRLRARRRRHQFQRQRLGSGRSDLFQAGAFMRHTVGAAYLTRGAGLWLAGHHHRSHGDHRRHRSAARAVQCQCLVRPRRSRLPLRCTVMGGIGITPYAAGQFTAFDLPAYAEQALSLAPTLSRWPMTREDRHRHPQRTRPAHRQIIRAAGWRS